MADRTSPRPPSRSSSTHGGEAALTSARRNLLKQVQARSFLYFLDNQLPNGLILDRQSNGARGRYGLSNVNLDRGWVSRDVVGIDIGSVILALDNYLNGDRVRTVFQSLACVRRGMERLGFRPTPDPPTP